MARFSFAHRIIIWHKASSTQKTHANLNYMNLGPLVFNFSSNITSDQIPWLILTLLLLALLLAIFVFTLWMLVDLIRRPFPSSTQKIAWFLIIISFSLIGPSLYYFLVVKPKRSAYTLNQ